MERRLQWHEMTWLVSFSRMLGRVLDRGKFKNSLKIAVSTKFKIFATFLPTQ